MDVFAERVQRALGDAYLIERELGGGGMSRVFVAREVRLNRPVVIKVLPPETAADMSVERFQREMQLAGSLQHPHIVALLTAGGEADLLWYAMPYVEGESLGTRLARDGALPLGDAVRILRDVADALAYSHARNVVHRDIKPDNVLISGRHALVADFGVAKALREAAGPAHSTLTSIGMALGTPTYMAPEQAAADPHTDHRADLYSWGAMAYEMLAGRPPFQAPTPQAMLAAHVTQPVEPIGRYRANLPPALADVVMKALEKHPADRWQSADELLQRLEAANTPSGGTSPTSTMPSEAVRIEAERAVKRAHPARVLGLFALAAAAVVGIIWLITRVFALPDWVWIGSGVLMAAGLPIMLYTGRLERRRASARATGMFRFDQEAVHHGWFTWRRATLGGAIAVSGLLLLTIAFAASRALGIGPGATLFSAGKLDRADRLVLADFQSPTSDSTLGQTVTEALRVDLSQSPVIKLLEPREISAALERMQRGVGAAFSPVLAQEVALRENAKAVVIGEIATLGSGYVLTARVVTADSGATLLSVREQAQNDGELIAAVNRLSASLREKMGESLSTIRGTDPLDKVTTSSLEALQLYTRGVKASDRLENDTSIEMFERALEIDSTFAMAWRKLAVMYGNQRTNAAREREASVKAFELRNRLPPEERLLATANYYSRVDRQPERVLAAYRELLDRDSLHEIALNNISVQLSELGRNAEAERYLDRLVTLPTFYNAYLNHINVLVEQNKLAEADSLAVVYSASRMGAGAAMVRTQTLGAARRYAALDSLIAATEHADTLPRDVLRTVAFAHAQRMLQQGRVREAQEKLRAEAAIDAAAGRRELAANQYAIAAIAGMALGDSASAAAFSTLSHRLKTGELASLDSSEYPLFALAFLAAASERAADARTLMQLWRRSVDSMARFPGDLEGWNAIAAAAAGNWQAAARLASLSRAATHCQPCGGWIVGYFWDRAQQPDSAYAWYARMSAAPASKSNLGEIGLLEPLGVRRMGEIAETRGDTAAALQAYSRYLELRTAPDPALLPEVQTVKQRVAALRASKG